MLVKVGDTLLTLNDRTAVVATSNKWFFVYPRLGPALSTTQAPIPQYQSHPPPCVPQAIRDGDLGYHGFHPSRPGKAKIFSTRLPLKGGCKLPPL